jgi:molybdopterin/thiamine biosynthesis adenylyltransferase
VVEALARSGIGALTLIDLDDICITNINRQLPALTQTIGQPNSFDCSALPEPSPNTKDALLQLLAESQPSYS